MAYFICARSSRVARPRTTRAALPLSEATSEKTIVITLRQENAPIIDVRVRRLCIRMARVDLSEVT